MKILRIAFYILTLIFVAVASYLILNMDVNSRLQEIQFKDTTEHDGNDSLQTKDDTLPNM
jgi:hypothetical protein